MGIHLQQELDPNRSSSRVAHSSCTNWFRVQLPEMSVTIRRFNLTITSECLWSAISTGRNGRRLPLLVMQQLPDVPVREFVVRRGSKRWSQSFADAVFWMGDHHEAA